MCLCVCVCVCVCMNVYIRMFMYIASLSVRNTYAYMYTYTHMHTHTYKHTHTPNHPPTHQQVLTLAATSLADTLNPVPTLPDAQWNSLLQQGKVRLLALKFTKFCANI